MPLQLVAVKLTPLELLLLDDLVEVYGYKSRSDFLRKAITEMARFSTFDEERMMALRIERLGHPLRRKPKKEEGQDT